MATVFISGSQSLYKLNNKMIINIYNKLYNIIAHKFDVVVGDADGAEASLQTFLNIFKYKNVTVYYSGNKIKNNIGKWTTRKIEEQNNTTEKDKAMINVADYGVIIWDGKSEDSFNNIFGLIKQNKKVFVYFAPMDEFFTIRDIVEFNKISKTFKKYLNENSK